MLGTTGEATSFSLAERQGLMSAYREHGLPMDRLMVGTGAAAVSDAVALTRHAAELGFAGALLLPPFYYKGVPDDGLVAYVGAIVEATAEKPIPIYLYHFPALSGLPWHVKLIGQLLERFGARIAGLKDSSGDMPYAREAAKISTELRRVSLDRSVLCSRRGPAFSRAASRRRRIAMPISARARGILATRPRPSRRWRSANCSTARRWCPASRRCSPISMAIRLWRG